MDPGATVRLVEAVVALLLGVALLVGTWTQATAVKRQAMQVDSVVADIEARRIAGLVIDMDAGGAVGASSPNEVEVRAYRWWGRPCWTDGEGRSLHVIVRGLRRPAPEKDSVVALDEVGRSTILPLRRVSRSRQCDTAAVELEWDGSLRFTPVLVRGFERGAYRLDEALRYRRGAGGAQPLTATRFDPDSVSLRLDARSLRLGLPPWRSRSWPR